MRAAARMAQRVRQRMVILRRYLAAGDCHGATTLLHLTSKAMGEYQSERAWARGGYPRVDLPASYAYGELLAEFRRRCARRLPGSTWDD